MGGRGERAAGGGPGGRGRGRGRGDKIEFQWRICTRHGSRHAHQNLSKGPRTHQCVLCTSQQPKLIAVLYAFFYFEKAGTALMYGTAV